jgi:L-ascorbate metabolism protein UlaG (beta-lactamase superfamily)
MPHIRVNSRKDVRGMRIRWYGQSAFLLSGERSVLIDPFRRPDDARLAARGTIFCFALDGVRCCHLGDFGQPALRPEPQAAIWP